MGIKRKYKGGMHAFVGKALNYDNFSTYPGVTNHGGNHYGLNPWKVDLNTGNITNERDFSIFPNVYTNGLRGGYVYNKNSYNKKFSKNFKTYKRNNTYKKKTNKSRSQRSSRRRKLRGGLGPLLSDAVTGTRVMGNNVMNVYNTLSGYPDSPSPLPYKGQLVSSTNI